MAANRRSDPERLEAFSDGVMAVIITIMAFDIHQPGGSRLSDLRSSVPSLLVYALSFAFIGIYWNNHHHLLRSTERISAGVMWANIHLLFWLSLIPSVTQWMAKYNRSSLPASTYGVVGTGAAVAYLFLVLAILRANGPDSDVGRSLDRDVKGRVSIALYVLAAGLAWLSPWIAYAIYIGVSVVWFVPDRRLERGSPEMAPE